ncbi:hypothetical protein [Kordia sp.]|uniref:hypothetical protein n=1 Tax=Kordia sp. TaxID=1965332 RepID=UPI003D2676D2
MKKITLLFLLLCSLYSCVEKEASTNIEGTWKMVYAETIENDTIKLKDLSNTTFVKIINKSHFAFFNQENNSNTNFYGGAGTYTLKGKNYTEILNFTAVEALKRQEFSFTIELKGDTLIQAGIEKVEDANIDRYIIEKYIKLKK